MCTPLVVEAQQAAKVPRIGFPQLNPGANPRLGEAFLQGLPDLGYVERGQLLRAAVGFAGCSMPSYDCALHALRTWLDSWAGIGHVAVGMHRQGFDLQVTQYDERGWRATFYTTGMGTQSRVPLEMIALSGVRSSCDMLARNSDLWLLRGQTRSPPRKRSRGRAKRRFAPARNVSSPGAPQLPVGDYTVRARLIYDLNRYSDPEHTGSQTEIYRAFLAIRVAN